MKQLGNVKFPRSFYGSPEHQRLGEGDGLMALGLYLHIPFCRKKCHYCDFVSYPMAEAELVEIFCRPWPEMELYSRRPSA